MVVGTERVRNAVHFEGLLMIGCVGKERSSQIDLRIFGLSDSEWWLSFVEIGTLGEGEINCEKIRVRFCLVSEFESSVTWKKD